VTGVTGRAHLLGDEINTDVHCSSKYLPGRDAAYIAQRAFEQVAPGFAAVPACAGVAPGLAVASGFAVASGAA